RPRCGAPGRPSPRPAAPSSSTAPRIPPHSRDDAEAYGSGDPGPNQTAFEMKAMTRSRSNDAADPADPAPSPPARPPTRWGDREQRRLDILDAARSRIEGGGYLALNMRDLAA